MNEGEENQGLKSTWELAGERIPQELLDRAEPPEEDSQPFWFDLQEKKDRKAWADEYPKLNAMKDWLLTSRIVPTSLQLELKKSKHLDKTGGAHKVVSHAAVEDAFKQSMGGKGLGILHALKALCLKANGIDGYDHLNQTLTCADGTTVPFGPEDMTGKMVFLSLLALPTRPETVVVEKYMKEVGYNERTEEAIQEPAMRYKPQISGLQMLRNLIGGYIPFNEKVTGVDDDGNKATFNSKWRWTQKKGFIVFLSLIRVPLFVAIYLVTYPFRLARNILRTATEVILPFCSLLLIDLNKTVIGYFKEHFTAATGSNLKYERFADLFSSEDSDEEDSKKGRQIGRALRRIGYSLAAFVLGVLSLALVIVQYAMSLVCRVGLALTSPLKSAWLAYNSGVLILGPKNSTSIISRCVGWLGFGLSMAFSVTLWAIALPLALGALVTAVPALLTPITTLSQSPFIATVLAWLTQLPFMPVMATAFNTAFGVVGGALAATFGKAVLGLGALLSVAIPEVVVTLSLVVSIVVMPVASLITWAAEVINNAFMRWAEQSPFSNPFSKSKKSADEKDAEKAERLADILKSKEGVRVHQPKEGGMIILTAACVRLVTESNRAKAEADRAIVNSFLVKDETQLKLLNEKAFTGNGYRYATDAEFKGSENIPAVVKDNGESVPVPAC
jgi:hypothetical protein